MTWRHPKKIPKTGEVIDSEDLNEGFRNFVEADGHLSEGNFSTSMASTLTPQTDLADDVANRVGSRKSLSYAGGPISAVTNEVRVRIGPGWSRIAEASGLGLSREIQVEVGPVVLVASFQAGRLNPATGDASTPDAFFMNPRFAFRVNGSVINASVVGDQDYSKEGEGMELGPWNYLHGVDMFYVLPIGPGKHLIEVVASAEGDPDSLASAEEAVMVYNRELVYWEVK